jgi:hypothetical protein
MRCEKRFFTAPARADGGFTLFALQQTCCKERGTRVCGDSRPGAPIAEEVDAIAIGLEDFVCDAGACAVWLQGAVDPVWPELVFEIEGADDEVLACLPIDATA